MQNTPISQPGKVFSLVMGGTDALPLRAGEIVTAEVVKVGPNNDVAIRVKNTLMNVQTDILLRKGDALSLRVERQENAVYLRLAGTAADETGSIRNTILSALNKLEGLSSGTEGMTKLVELLSALPASLKENLPEIDVVNRFLLNIDDLSGQSLREAVQNGGVFFETKLRILAQGMEAEGSFVDGEAGRVITGDLKASLLRLKDTFLSPAVLEHIRTSVNTDDLLGALNTVLRNIEYYQMQSKLTDTLQFFLPLIWKELRDGEVILRQYDRGRPGESSYACTVNLDLERAGKVKVSLVYQAGYVHVTCAAENDAFMRMLRNGADELAKQFESAGVRIGHYAVHHQRRIDFEQTGSAEGLSIRV